MPPERTGLRKPDREDLLLGRGKILLCRQKEIAGIPSICYNTERNTQRMGFKTAVVRCNFFSV